MSSVSIKILGGTRWYWVDGVMWVVLTECFSTKYLLQINNLCACTVMVVKTFSK